jgi:hypothetical protein
MKTNRTIQAKDGRDVSHVGFGSQRESRLRPVRQQVRQMFLDREWSIQFRRCLCQLKPATFALPSYF